jgi:short-subunit dehydrogenase
MAQDDKLAPVAATRGVTLVTGASSGIGRELALLAAREGEVVLVARNSAGLEALAAEIEAAGGRASWLACDGEEPDAAGRILNSLAKGGQHCRQLVNNAGFGLVGLAHDISRDGQLGSIALNVRFLTDLALSVLPGMIARREGGILNVSSVAGFLPGPRMAVYYATKAYVQSFSESLWQETRGTGVRVTALCPGPVNTGFLGRATDGERAFEATRFHVAPALVASVGWEGFLRGERTVIPGFSNRIAVAVSRFLPRGLLLDMVMRRQSGRTGPRRPHS